MAPVPGYVPLWCKSHGSFLEGASDPETLLDRAVELGLPAVAITDRDGMYAIVRAHVGARNRMKLIVGAQVTAGEGDVRSTIVLLAQSRQGYANLCRLLTCGRRRSEKGDALVSWPEVAAHAGDLLALWGGDASLLARAPDPDVEIGLMREAFGDRLHAMVARHRRDTEVAEEARVRARAARHRLPIVAAVEVLYAHPSARALQDVMTCIRHGVTIHGAGRLLKPNAGHALPTPAQFTELFADDPVAVERTHEVAARCAFSLDTIRYRYPEEHVPGGMTSTSWLRHLAYEGMRRRSTGEVPPSRFEQIEKELQLIEELDYGGYFLTMHEIVSFCEDKGILCQGRGSAANSLVC
jgi:error-prone DNA polymerase